MTKKKINPPLFCRDRSTGSFFRDRHIPFGQEERAFFSGIFSFLIFLHFRKKKKMSDHDDNTNDFVMEDSSSTSSSTIVLSSASLPTVVPMQQAGDEDTIITLVQAPPVRKRGRPKGAGNGTTTTERRKKSPKMADSTTTPAASSDTTATTTVIDVSATEEPATPSSSEGTESTVSHAIVASAVAPARMLANVMQAVKTLRTIEPNKATSFQLKVNRVPVEAIDALLHRPVGSALATDLAITLASYGMELVSTSAGGVLCVIIGGHEWIKPGRVHQLFSELLQWIRVNLPYVTLKSRELLYPEPYGEPTVRDLEVRMVRVPAPVAETEDEVAGSE